MSQATDYLETALINHLFGNITLTSPTTMYCALFTVTPNDAGSGAELHTSGGYSRQAVTFGLPLTGSTGNTSTVTFRLAKMTKFNLNFKKPVSIQVENLSRSKLIGSDPAVRMEVPVVVKRTTEPPLPVRSVAKSLKEWYQGGNK